MSDKHETQIERTDREWMFEILLLVLIAVPPLLALFGHWPGTGRSDLTVSLFFIVVYLAWGRKKKAIRGEHSE